MSLYTKYSSLNEEIVYHYYYYCNTFWSQRTFILFFFFCMFSPVFFFFGSSFSLRLFQGHALDKSVLFSIPPTFVLQFHRYFFSHRSLFVHFNIFAFHKTVAILASKNEKNSSFVFLRRLLYSFIHNFIAISPIFTCLSPF